MVQMMGTRSRQEYSYSTSSMPRVTTNAYSTLSSYGTSTLPSSRPKWAGNYTSNLSSPRSNRNLIDIEPLKEKRRHMSVQSRPVTTTNYWAESVKRHRDCEASRLREYLKAKESDANSPWNKPAWPGPRRGDDGMSMSELDHLKKAANQSSKDDMARRMARWNELEQKNRMDEMLRRQNEDANKQLALMDKGKSLSMSNLNKNRGMETVKVFEERRRTEETEHSIRRGGRGGNSYAYSRYSYRR